MDEIYLGAQKTLDGFFRTQLTARQRGQITAACVDMWTPFTQSLTEWVPQCRIVYDKFHEPMTRSMKCGGPNSSAREENGGG